MIAEVTDVAGNFYPKVILGECIGLHMAEKMLNDYKEQVSHFVLPPPPPPPVRRRRPPRNYHWTQKGTKQSRREARARHVSATSSTLVPPTKTSRFDDRPTWQIKECKRRVGKRNLGGYFTYCYHHRHLNVSPTVKASRRNVTVRGPVPSPLDPNVQVEETTDHATAAREHVSSQQRQIDFADALPKLRRARCVYAYAQGLHTRLHYPQQFLVTLNGEPAVKNDWTVSPCMVSGHSSAASALKHVVHVVANRDVHPKSLCNHKGCIYNQGDLITRRARFLASIKKIDDILDKAPSSSSSAYLVTHSACKDVILDSGSGRHIHNTASHFSSVRPCSPQTLTGFTGKRLTISTCGTVGNFTNVLLVPSSHASVRPVSAALDARGGQIVFSTTTVSYVSPDGTSTVIRHRTNYGLYALKPGAIPPPAANTPVLIAAPVQVRREAIHRLHQSLAHASIERMRYIIKNCPTLCGSLTTRDLALFTTCPACNVGKCRAARSPKSTSTRFTLVGYRLHADTTGTIRPSTRGGFNKALIVVDDASRWIFVQLLRTNTMQEVSRKFEIILRAASGDAHVLRTRVVRSDNGTEFVNSAICQRYLHKLEFSTNEHARTLRTKMVSPNMLLEDSCQWFER